MTRRFLGLTAISILLGMTQQGTAMAQTPPKPKKPLAPPRPRPYEEPH